MVDGWYLLPCEKLIRKLSSSNNLKFTVMAICSDRLIGFWRIVYYICISCRTDPIHVYATGMLITWHPGHANNLASFTPIFLKIFALGQGWERFWGRVPKLRIILVKILSRVETWVYQHHIADNSSNFSAPLAGWNHGQPTSWPVA